jgi:hypothetical protein
MAAVTAIVGTLATVGATVYAANKSSSAANRATDAARSAQDRQFALAEDQWDNWKTNYKPLEENLIRSVNAYDTTERRDAAASEAIAGQQAASDGAQRQLGEALNERGVDPSEGQYQASMRDIAIRGAANAANAGNMARRAVEDTGFNRMAGLAAMGRGLQQSAAAGFGNAANGAMQMANFQNQQAANNATGMANFANQFGKSLKEIDWPKGTGTPSFGPGASGKDYDSGGFDKPPINYWGA